MTEPCAKTVLLVLKDTWSSWVPWSTVPIFTPFSTSINSWGWSSGSRREDGAGSTWLGKAVLGGSGPGVSSVTVGLPPNVTVDLPLSSEPQILSATNLS